MFRGPHYPSSAGMTSGRENDLAEDLSTLQGGKALACLVHEQDPVNHGADAGTRAEREQVFQLLSRSHGRAQHPKLEEVDPAQLRVCGPARRRAGEDHGPSWAHGTERVLPGRRTNSLHHGVDPLRQPFTGPEDLVSTQLD